LTDSTGAPEPERVDWRAWLLCAVKHLPPGPVDDVDSGCDPAADLPWGDDDPQPPVPTGDVDEVPRD